MKQTKLRRIHVVIIGIVVCLIIGAGMFFVLIKKSNETLNIETKRRDQYAPTGTPQNVQAAERDRDAARREVADAQIKLDKYMKSKMPMLNFQDPAGAEAGTGRMMGMIQLYNEKTETLAPLIYRWARKSRGVTISGDLSIPTPSFNPNDTAFEADVYTLPIGKLKAKGTYKAIMDHIRNWSSCGRLVSVNGLSFTGSSPNLECEYDLTVYLMPRFKADSTKPLGMANAAAGAPGAPTP
jgi:Tfp pilus assembly protein PilO